MEENKKDTLESTKTGDRMLTGMFNDRHSAEKAYNSLHERGYAKDDINLLMSDNKYTI